MADVHPFGHESPGVKTRQVVTLGLGLFGVVLIALVILYFTTASGLLSRHAEVVRRPGVVPASPQLQPHPTADLARFRRDKHTALTSYGWTDASHRFAHIPIQRAMQLYVHQQNQAAATSRAKRPAR